MRVIIPFAGSMPKTRLSDVLSLSERRSFARAMLQDVLAAVQAAGHEPVLLTPSPLDSDVSTIVDDQPLSGAVNAVLSDSDLPVTVLMADLPLITATDLAQFVETQGDVVLAPGLGGGTNALVVRDRSFAVDYHGTSYLDHLETAQEMGLDVSEATSWRLTVDIDEPPDLAEVLLHNDGHASRWLAERGFSMVKSTGRANAIRTRDVQSQSSN